MAHDQATDHGFADLHPEVILQIHALENSVRELARKNHELQVQLAEARDLLEQVYGSRGWRVLEMARRVRRGGA